MSCFNKLLFFFILFFALLVPFAGTQTLYTIEGTAPSIAEFVGQPALGCSYPNGPLLDVIPANQPFGPFAFGPFAPPPAGTLGDVAVDLDDDEVWATNGEIFNRFDGEGVIDDQFMLPAGWPPMTGLGCDSEHDRLWVTDGFQAAAISSPGGAPWIASVEVAPFPLWGWPLAGIVQDIEWDPCTGTLWVVTNAGELANFFIGGAPVPGGFSIVAPGPYALMPNLTGLGMDTGNQAFFVTDGSRVAHIDRFGGAVAPTFYYPNGFEDVFPVYGAPAPLSGLAFSLRAVTYGDGGDDLLGPPVPAISAMGQSCSPNPTFGFRLEDATPGGGAFLALGIDSLCPPLPINPASNLYVHMPFLWFAGPLAVFPDGTVTLPLAIPAFGCADPAVGLTLYAQWLINRLGGWETSEGLSFTIGMR